MEHLYAPWRTDYVTGTDRPEGCVFCAIVTGGRDEADGVVWREEDIFVVMNRYPYAPGHFMIIPHAHVDAVENLDETTWLRISQLARHGVRLLKEGFGAHGVNLGMNLGKAGGAGIAEHLHLHLVPRFERDTNFITAITDTRVYPTDFVTVYRRIADLWHQNPPPNIRKDSI